MNNDWIEWNGGECPVGDDDLVDIEWDDDWDGDWGFDGIPAQRIDWQNEAPFFYRLHKQEESE